MESPQSERTQEGASSTLTPEVWAAIEKAHAGNRFLVGDMWPKLGYSMRLNGCEKSEFARYIPFESEENRARIDYFWEGPIPNGITKETIYHVVKDYLPVDILARPEIKQIIDTPEEIEIPTLASQFHKLIFGSKTVFLRRGLDISTAMSKPDFLSAFENQCTKKTIRYKENGEIIDKDVRVNVAKEFTKMAQALYYTFNPEESKYFYNSQGDICYNAFSGFPYQGKEGDEENGQLLLDFITEIIAAGDNQVAEFILDYMAHKLQRPGYKVGKIIAMRSEQGAGKGAFFEIFSRLLNRKNSLTISSVEDLTSTFNGEFQTCLLAFLDEAMWGGNKGGRDVLKVRTNREWKYHYKGKTPFNAPNYTDFLIATNQDWVAPVEKGDRRYLVLDVSPKYINNADYFNSLFEAMEDGGLAWLDGFLRQRNITINFNSATCIPNTKAKSENFILGLPQEVRAFISFLRGELYQKGAVLTPETTISSGGLKEILKNELNIKGSVDHKLRILNDYFPTALVPYRNSTERGYNLFPNNIIPDLRKKLRDSKITEDML